MADDSETLNLICALLEHLIAHPQRADGSQGIARWWLGGEVNGLALEQALACLKDENLIEALFAADGRVRWHRKAEVARLIERLAALRAGPALAQEDPCRP